MTDADDDVGRLVRTLATDPAAARSMFLSRWRELGPRSPDVVRRLALELAEPPPGDVEYSLAYATTFRHTGGHPRAIRLLEGLVDAEPAGRHAEDLAIEIRLELAGAYRSAGRLDDARNVLDDLESRLSTDTPLSDRIRWSARVRHDRAVLAVHEGRFREAQRFLEETPPASALTSAGRAEADGVRAFLAWTRGTFDAVDDALRDRDDEHADRAAAALAFTAECLVAVERGRLEDAARAADAAERAGLGSEWEGFVRYARATTVLLSGDTASALNELERADRAVLHWQGAPIVRILSEGMRAVVFLHLGRVEAAMAILDDLASTENHSNCPGRFRAALALLRGDAAGAREMLQSCLDLGAGHSERTLVDVLTILAAIEYHDGDDAAGDLAFDRAMRIALENEMQTTFFLLQLSVLERMASRARERPQPPGVDAYLERVLAFASTRPFAIIEPLSERELEVAQMAAADHTVASIAAELWISQNTAKSHLRRIYQRLAVSNRAELRARLRALGIDADQDRAERG